MSHEDWCEACGHSPCCCHLQGSLFGDDELDDCKEEGDEPTFAPTEPRTLARAGDPKTSKEAAAIMADDLAPALRYALECVKRYPGLTVKEMAKEEECGDNRTIGRRLSKLVEEGLVRVSGVRKCSVTSRNAQTYEVSE